MKIHWNYFNFNALKVFATLLTLFFVFQPAMGDSAAPGAPLQLALNWKAEPQFGGFYSALQNGHFKKFDLKVEIQEGGAGTPTVQMVSAGRADYGIVSADELLIARSRGADLVALFAVYQTNPQSIMTHAERGFKTLGELMAADGILSWQDGLPYANFLKKKYPSAKVKFVPYLGGIGNYLASPKFSQQCFFTSEPLLVAKKNVKTKTFLVSEEGFNPYTTVVITTRTHAKANPDEIKHFVTAIRLGWTDYLKDSTATNSFMAGLNHGMSLDTFRESAEAQKALIQPRSDAVIGRMTNERWAQLSQQLLDLKLVSKVEKPGDVMLGEF